MINLTSLLERFSKSLGRDTVLKQTVIQCIQESLGFNLPLADISIKGDTLIIKSTPAKKNEIRLHEAKLISDICTRCQTNLKRILYI